MPCLLETGAKDTATAAVSSQDRAKVASKIAPKVAPGSPGVTKRQPGIGNVRRADPSSLTSAARPFLMKALPQITEAELTQARQDPAYRQRLLRQSLDALLGILQRENRLSRGATDNERLREGVNMAVRLAELIQTADDPDRGP
jgi:hypothetical protein